MSLLELKNVSKIYGSLHALDHVSLKVEKGEWLAIMGPSGSGKSTMMNIIGALDKATEGEILLDGVDIAKKNAKALTDIRRDKIGLIFQQFHLVSYLTAVENVTCRPCPPLSKPAVRRGAAESMCRPRSDQLSGDHSRR